MFEQKGWHHRDYHSFKTPKITNIPWLVLRIEKRFSKQLDLKQHGKINDADELWVYSLNLMWWGRNNVRHNVIKLGKINRQDIFALHCSQQTNIHHDWCSPIHKWMTQIFLTNQSQTQSKMIHWINLTGYSISIRLSH